MVAFSVFELFHFGHLDLLASLYLRGSESLFNLLRVYVTASKQ
jgi:hypothetical protein